MAPELIASRKKYQNKRKEIFDDMKESVGNYFKLYKPEVSNGYTDERMHSFGRTIKQFFNYRIFSLRPC